MKTKRNLLVAGGLSAMVLSAASATAVTFQPLVVTNLGGTLQLVQNVPCDNVVRVATDVNGGQIEMTPARGIDIERSADKIFNLTRLTLVFQRFSVRGDCQGFRDTHQVSEIGIQLASAVSFRAVAAGRNKYRVTIPRDQFLLTESFVDNGVPKTFYQKPSEDVTGFIDLGRGTMRLHIASVVQLRFRAGCTSLPRCVIDVLKGGTQTADIAGTIVFPGTPTTAPR